ncbi:META domain-containing protein [Kribbella sp. NBC_00889]|uniref:META domain-containing protein n=1 Tax=Kribbella sp. NBC_00889 TaxID=2975974 RepID=UPI00386D6E27|nr:META domain-containing protein [Kribbella sp. NBC_00889]
MRMIAVAGAGLLLALTACGNESTAGGTLTGKSWLSTAVTENGAPKQLAQNTRVRLQFTDDGRLIADAGCNSMQSKVSTGDGKLSLKDGLMMTDMGCPGRQDQDGWLSGILSSKPSWKLDGDTLNVTSGGTTIALQDRETAEPDLALDGTKWALNTVITGEVASHQAGSEKAWMTLNGERVTGSTGCNEFQGMVAQAPGKLTFGELATTRRACAGDAAKLESSLLNGLKGEVSYEIDSSKLELRNAAGGLDFTAVR